MSVSPKKQGCYFVSLVKMLSCMVFNTAGAEMEKYTCDKLTRCLVSPLPALLIWIRYSKQKIVISLKLNMFAYQLRSNACRFKLPLTTFCVFQWDSVFVSVYTLFIIFLFSIFLYIYLPIKHSPAQSQPHFLPAYKSFTSQLEIVNRLQLTPELWVRYLVYDGLSSNFILDNRVIIFTSSGPQSSVYRCTVSHPESFRNPHHHHRSLSILRVNYINKLSCTEGILFLMTNPSNSLTVTFHCCFSF